MPADLDYFGAKPVGVNPQRAAATVGMWLFLASLVMLFAASILGYALIRLGPGHRNAPPLHLPWLLWVSTVMVFGVSIALHRALGEVKRERQGPFRKWIRISLILGIAFVAIQAPALVMLMNSHRVLRASGVGFYGLIFSFILLHALHVVGGIVRLIVVTHRSFAGAYDHEHYLPVRYVAMYWHFLDVVWVIMFLTFWLIG